VLHPSVDASGSPHQRKVGPAEGDRALVRDNQIVDPVARGGRAHPQAPLESPAVGDSERELVRALLARDRKAAAAFVAAHIDAVYSYARHRLTPRQDLADDVVQEVFLAAFNGLAAFHGRSSLRTWLIGIARHKIEDIYRHRLRTPDAFEDHESATAELLAQSPAIDEQIDGDRARQRTHRILAEMPQRYGLILLWRYWEQRSTRDMAAAIGTTEKSLERMLARARAAFRARWLGGTGR
jgi:RNA polymerase sigma-70 factor, ECF subfamily